MSIEQPYNYRIPNHINDIKNEEEKVIALLRNIRANASLFRLEFARETLQNILEAVEKGEWSFKNLNVLNKDYLDKTIEKNVVLNHNINLSEAKQIIDDYIHHSKKGCESCINLGKIYKEMETGRYCKLDEDESSVIGLPISDFSVKIREFYETGCENKKPVFRPLETVLLEESLKTR